MRVVGLWAVGLWACAVALAWGGACGGDRASVAPKAAVDTVAIGAASGDESAKTEAAPGSEAPAAVRRDPALEAVQGLPARAADEVRASVKRPRPDADATPGASEPEAQ